MIFVSYKRSGPQSPATPKEGSLLSPEADKRAIEFALLERFVFSFGETSGRALGAADRQQPLEDSFAASYARMRNPALAGVVDLLESRYPESISFDKFPAKE